MVITEDTGHQIRLLKKQTQNQPKQILKSMQILHQIRSSKVKIIYNYPLDGMEKMGQTLGIDIYSDVHKIINNPIDIYCIFLLQMRMQIRRRGNFE
jgi:hypothetical protein